MSEPAVADVRERRRISFIWVVPIVALLIGVWMVVHTLRTQGPEITISFSSGAGIEADKTKIKVREVEVGLVESVGLSEDLGSVVVTAKLDKAAESLLREDSEFWVVRARVGLAGVSGLGTLLSGSYIQLAPGTGEAGRREFEGLEEPPITPVGTPGLALRLVSDSAGSLGTGDPILYKGYRVGRIESTEFDVENEQMRYRAFIDAPFDDLVSSATRFWNASGISASVTADGIRVSTGSLESLLAGGATFGLPDGVGPGSPVQADAVFKLYPDYDSVNQRPHRYGVDFVLLFERSVRGLEPGAPVEFRGIRVGRVERILVSEAVAEGGFTGEGQAIPVLIRVEPGRLELPDTAEAAERLREVLGKAVGNGLRASLSTGSLITGSLYVYLDMYPDAEPAEVERFASHPVVPTIGSGLEGLQAQVSSLLAKVEALPIERVLDRVDRLLADVNTLVASDELQSLPASLDGTLAELQATLASLSGDSVMQERLLTTITELDRTLASLRNVLQVLEEQPNALIFNRDPGEDPRPPSGAR